MRHWNVVSKLCKSSYIPEEKTIKILCYDIYIIIFFCKLLQEIIAESIYFSFSKIWAHNFKNRVSTNSNLIFLLYFKAYIPGSSPSCASSSEPTSPAINSLRNFEAYRVNDVTKTNGNFEQYRVNDVTKAQRIYQNHSPKMSGQLDDNPPPLPARGGAPLPVTTNGGAPAPNHGVIPFFPFHQFPGRSVKPNCKFKDNIT